MKFSSFLLLVFCLIYVRGMHAVDIESVGNFLINLKHLVTRLMAASIKSNETHNTVLVINPKLRDVVEQAKHNELASSPKNLQISWSDSLKSVVAAIKPKTDIYIGGLKRNDKGYKFEPGIIMALLNMMVFLPKIIPDSAKMNALRNLTNSVSPYAAEWNGQVRTLTLRLTCIYNLITSAQKVIESFLDPDRLLESKRN